MSVDALNHDLLIGMLTELRLDAWLPLFSAAHVDVFQWLAMDRDIHFAAIGIHDPAVRYQLALFARALQAHLNPALAPFQHHGDTAMSSRISRALAVFDAYTGTLRRPGSFTSSLPVSRSATPPMIVVSPSPTPSTPSSAVTPAIATSLSSSSTLRTRGERATSIRWSSVAQEEPAPAPAQTPPPPSYSTAMRTHKTTTSTAKKIMRRLSLKRRPSRDATNVPRVPIAPMATTAQTEQQNTSNPPSTTLLTPPSPPFAPSSSSSSSLSPSSLASSTAMAPNPPLSPPASPIPRRLLPSAASTRPRPLSMPTASLDSFDSSSSTSPAPWLADEIDETQESSNTSRPSDAMMRRRWEKCRSCVILPREEEGREELPAYQCTVYKMGHVYVKKERDAPGVRSRWRSWNWMYLELWGTLLRFYHAKDAAVAQAYETATFSNHNTVRSHQHQHQFHHPRHEMSVSTKFIWQPILNTRCISPQSTFPSSSMTNPACVPQSQSTLITTLNLAGADASRALDYTKRPNTLRLTIHQGPQLLLRLSTAMEMVSWIEHLQAAINISLDLESRPMPKFMTLPGRLATAAANDPRTLHLERLREQRYREHGEMMI